MGRGELSNLGKELNVANPTKMRIHVISTVLKKKPRYAQKKTILLGLSLTVLDHLHEPQLSVVTSHRNPRRSIG